MRVLQISNDSAQVHQVEGWLEPAGLKIESTDHGDDAISLARIYDYDAILLDDDLPDMTGLNVLRRLRAAGIKTPVIYLDAGKGNEAFLLDAGVDDFLRKPFRGDVLVSRLRAVIRRTNGHATGKIEVGPVCVDTDQKIVRVHGRAVHLTGKEYQILELLSLRKSTTLTKEMFLNHLYGSYGGQDEPEIKIIDVFVCKLRKKLRDAGADGLIATIWGRGYALRLPEAVAA